MLSYREDLHDVVGGGPDGIHVLLAEDPHEAHTVRLQDPLLQGLELTFLRDDDLLLVVSLGQMHVHLEERRGRFDSWPQAGISLLLPMTEGGWGSTLLIWSMPCRVMSVSMLDSMHLKNTSSSILSTTSSS